MDKACQLLFQHSRSLDGSMIVVADENSRNSQWHLLDKSNTQLITNRIDIATQIMQAGYSCQFNDFDFSNLPAAKHILLRISKEKLLTHHLINSSINQLQHGGTLWLCGEKNEGIKSYIKQCEKTFALACSVNKQGNNYLVSIVVPEGFRAPDFLPDDDYPTLRPILDGTLVSKPGQFGWQKADQGSLFLIDNLADVVNSFHHSPARVLDLGCGYGLLAAAANRLLPEANITATDNNAAAIASCQQNFMLHNINGGVCVGDVGDCLEGRFDLILCNPPFHQGFNTSGDLTERFVATMHRRLASKGKALVVVNQFVPLAARAAKYFKTCRQIDNNRSYSLYVLQH